MHTDRAIPIELWAVGAMLLSLAACGATDSSATTPGASAPLQTSLPTRTLAPASALAPSFTPAPQLATATVMQPSRSATVASVAPTQQIAQAGPTPAPPEPRAATSAPALELSWASYHNTQSGYRVDYPADWRVFEVSQSGESGVTRFNDPTGKYTITISVRIADTEPNQLHQPPPGARCLPLGGANRPDCLQPVVFLKRLADGRSQLYTISYSGGGLDEQIVRHFASSFSIGA